MLLLCYCYANPQIDDEKMMNNLDKERVHANMVWAIFSSMAIIEFIVNDHLLETQTNIRPM